MLLSKNYLNLYTSPRQASQIIYIIKKYSTINDILIDASAGIGGNSIFFCKYFSYVYCIDISHESIYYLEHNLTNYNNKFIIHDSCIDYLKLLYSDIVFFDPPWGDKYKENNNINLYLSEININTIIESLYFRTKIVALKAPINYKQKELHLWKIKKYNIYKNDNSTIMFNLFVFYK